MTDFRQRATHKSFRGQLAGVFVLASALYAVPSIWLLQNYLQPAFDLAIYDQTLWLIARGEWFNTIIGSHVFGVHFSPILVLLSPLSFIPGGASPEIIFQSLVLASGVFPAAGLARRFEKSPTWFVTVYALHPAIIGGSWYGLRPWNLAVPVFMWAIYWIAHKPGWLRITVAGLVLLTFREDLAVWVGLVALILLLSGRIPWRDLVISGVILGTASGIVLLGVLPAFSPIGGYFFASSSEASLPVIGSAVSSVLVRLLFLLIPLGVAPSKVRWRLALPLALPIAGLLIKGGNALTTFFHYDMMFVPALLLVLALSPDASSRPRSVATASLVTILLFGVLRPIEPQSGPNPWRFDPDTTARADQSVEAASRILESHALSITAPSHLVPHFSERTNVFVFPQPVHGYEIDNLQLFCPDPNIVITVGDDDKTWQQVLNLSYTRVGGSDALPVWERDGVTSDDPCSADRS